MTWLKGMVERGLTATGPLWPPIRLAFGWVHRAAHILGQDDDRRTDRRGQLNGLLGAMIRHRRLAGPLGGAVDHFVTVSRSYWPGLFAGLATRTREVGAEQLAGADRARWANLRAELDERRRRRTHRRRFRHDPTAYLKDLEHKLNKSRLPT